MTVLPTPALPRFGGPRALARCFHLHNTYLRTRFRGSKSGNRGRGPESQILLDKFVKHVALDGSIVVRSPFNVKVRGSYFDKNNNVDRLKNRRVYDELYNTKYLTENRNAKASRNDEEEEELNEFTGSPEEAIAIEREIMEKLSQTLDSFSGSKSEQPMKLSPLHVLLYGRLHHRIDSYSIVDSYRKQQTHIYLTDANSFDEAESMLIQQIETMDAESMLSKPDAHFTILQPDVSIFPRDLEGKKLKYLLTPPEKGSKSEEEVVSAVKLFCPKHILDIPNPGIKTVFLTPTVMNRIYLQGDGSSNVDLDASLIHKLNVVGLNTDYGGIRVRDISSEEIRLSSQMGDIICEGNLEGHSVIEIGNDGDFIASYIDGPSLLATTEDGDVNIWGGVNSDVSQFYTRSGNINVKNLYNQCYMLVKEVGNVYVNVIEGFLTAMVKKGSITAFVDKLTGDSTLQVENGNVSLSVPKKRNYRITAVGPQVNVSPNISNQGELFLPDNSGNQTFQSNPNDKTSNHLPLPVLKIEVFKGSLSISLIPDAGDKDSSSKVRSESS